MRAERIIWQQGPIRRDGPGDDLLTAGLGLEGLRNLQLPEGVSPRVAAAHKDFRDLVDLSPGGGFEALTVTEGGGLKVPGREYVALVRLAASRHPVCVRVLVPDRFDWDRPMIVVAPSSGSRGATGAIGDIGSWALPQRCALVLTDKGTGGVQLLAEDVCFTPHLEPTEASDAPTNFRLKPTSALRRFCKAHPGAIALKHAHCMENIEAAWPDAVLAAARYGLEVMKTREGSGKASAVLNRIKVVAAGVSNGGGAVLRAAEADRSGLLHGVISAEPNITPPTCHGGRVRFDDGAVKSPGRLLISYATVMNLLLPAALGAAALQDHPYAEMSAQRATGHAEWASGLGRYGLIEGTSHSERASDALSRIRALGFATGSEPLLHMMFAMQIWPAVSHTFVSAYGRYPVDADPVGAYVAFSSADAFGQAQLASQGRMAEQKRLFGALSGGLSPGGGAFTIYRNGKTEPDLADAIALHDLCAGRTAAARRVRAGAGKVLASARSRGAPTIILHGRCDPLISAEHASRAYFAAVSASGTDTRNWRYYEHETAQHFESLLMVPGLSQRFNPLLPSLHQSLELMREHLFRRGALPESQVLRRALPDKTGQDGLAMRAPIRGDIQPEAGANRIEYTDGVLNIPA